MKEKSGRDLFRKYEVPIGYLTKLCKMLPKRIQNIMFVFCRNIKGKKGMLFRYVLLKNLAKEAGNNVSIHEGVYLFNLENLFIGTNVSIHPQCYIECCGGIMIGNDVSIAHNVTILSVEHKYANTREPIKYQGIEKKIHILNRMFG